MPAVSSSEGIRSSDPAAIRFSGSISSVLRASGGLIVILPADGIDLGCGVDLFSSPHLRLQGHGLCVMRDRGPRLHRLGPPHVHKRDEPHARHCLHDVDGRDRGPFRHQNFNWLGTMWRGNIRFRPPMLCAVGFLSMFIIGGLTVFLRRDPGRYLYHNTYFVIGHFHFMMVGGALFGMFAGDPTTGSPKCSGA